MNIIRDFATIASRDPTKLGRISIRKVNLHWTRPVYLYRGVLDAFVINVPKGRQNHLQKLIISNAAGVGRLIKVAVWLVLLWQLLSASTPEKILMDSRVLMPPPGRNIIPLPTEQKPNQFCKIIYWQRKWASLRTPSHSCSAPSVFIDYDIIKRIKGRTENY